MMDQAVLVGMLDGLRRLITQNDLIISLLEQVVDQGAKLTEAQDQTMDIVAFMVAASLNSAPRNTTGYVVGVAQTVLAENQSEPLMMIEITNHDPAQALEIGNDGVTILAGHEVAPLTTVPFQLPQGQRLFGVCTAATINVSVALLYPPIQLVNAIKESLQWTQALKH